MKKYFDYAIFFDFSIAIIIGIVLYYYKSEIKNYINPLSFNNISIFNGSLITLSATLIGFLLTIITVVVTFKNGFEDKRDSKEKDGDKKFIEALTIPEQTIFDKTITKETKFYGTEVHRKVVKVFVQATYEIAMTLFILLMLQLNFIKFSLSYNLIISCCSFILIILSVIRCLYIFQLFLQVHIHNKSINCIEKK